MSRNPNIRFCQNNMLKASGVTITASGYKTGYPASNLTDDFRYKVWTPPGTFVVTTSNQKLYINDDSDATATITAGTYTYLTLPAAVATALNAVSTNWTCTYDFSGGTFKYTIGRSSGTAKLRCSETTNAAWDMLGYVGTVDQDAAAADESRNHTSEYLTIDLGVARSPKALFVIAAADGVFPLSSQATVTLKGDNINDFSDPAVSRTVTPEAKGIFHWLDDLSDTSYRYWKLEFSDPKNTAGPEGFSLNVAYLGDYVTPLNVNLSTGFGRTMVDPSALVESEAGVPYFQKRTKYWHYDSMSIEYLTDDDRTDLEAAYESLGTTEPFFIAVDPTKVVSATNGEFTKYVVFDQFPQMTHVMAKMWNHGFSVREVV